MSIGSVSRVLQLIGSLSDKWSWSQAPVLAGVHPAAMSLNRMLNLEFAMSLLSPRRDERECNRVLPQFTRIFISVNQILIYLSGLQGATIVVAHATKKLSSATKHFHLSHLKLSSLFFKQWMLSQFRICDFIPVCNLSHNVLRNFIKMYFWVHLKEKVSPCLQCTCQINWMQLKVTD